MKKLVMLFLLIPFIGSAQDKGTHFEHGLTWVQVKEKAKKENKYLLVDCFTTWCGPCKYMSNTIFPQDKMGDFFNKNFVNVKVQFDKTTGDSEEVKGWYKDADSIGKAYGIKAYPTFLIFSPNGDLVHRIVGGGDVDGFIAKAEKALHPETQYYTLLKKFEAGSMSPQAIKELVAVAEAAYDPDNSAKLSAAYLKTQTNLYTKENLDFLSRSIKDSKSEGFELMLKNRKKIDAILGKDKVDKILSDVVLKENIYPLLRSATVNLDSLIAVVKAKYPSIELNRSTSLLQVQFYEKTQKWIKYQPAVLSYMEKYGKDADGPTLNSFAWTVFENCEDADCIAAALSWSKRSVEKTQHKDAAILDTYANLLYKMGKKEEAIVIEQQGLDLVSAEEKGNYQKTLDKMKKGEKTWVNK
ncbi:thioredoxin family protein [Pedobacter cryoconitis]|uniref:Thioredoxin-related protein n=1 Tax=Pedobacter cryoconitis TaxID=188932 RepID=A0A7X0MLA6_9SPHI|nr:thioredoxin family protein [Pedobacter cryoconitis]MBB6502891.1 thioredoxin-related protein [Pedobacter cryoconitis]